MKKKILISTILMLVSLYIIPLTRFTIDAYDETTQIEITRINTSSLEDNFTDNTIAVVLSKEATFNGKVFTPSDFPEIDAILVEDETIETMAIVNAQIAAEESGMLSILQAGTSSNSMSRGILNRSQMTRYEKIIPFVERNLLFETDSFRRILRITLSQNCKENVLRSIRLLEQRDEIISACPNYIETISPSFIDFEPTNINLNWRNLIGLPAAHAITTGSASIKVGVIDSGIDAEHFNLAGMVCEDLSKNFAADDYSALTDPYGRAWGMGLMSLELLEQTGLVR